MKGAFVTLAVLLATSTAAAKTESEVNALKYVARGIAQTALVPSMKNPSAAIVCPLEEISWVAPAEQWYMDGEPVEADVFTGWIDGTNGFGATVRTSWQIHLLDGELLLIKLGNNLKTADGYGTTDTKAHAKWLAKREAEIEKQQLASQRLEAVRRLGEAAARKRASKSTRRIPAGMAASLAKSAAVRADIEKDERHIFVDGYLAALGY